MFWQRPTLIAKFQSLPRQISQFRGHFENRLAKKWKNRIASNKWVTSTPDIMIEFHWKNEANRWRSEICLIRSYADSLLKLSFILNCVLKRAYDLKTISNWFVSRSGPTFEKIAFNFRYVTLCTFRSLVGGILENS